MLTIKFKFAIGTFTSLKLMTETAVNEKYTENTLSRKMVKNEIIGNDSMPQLRANVFLI